EHAARFGDSATDFVRSAYDIQSAIAGLTGTELARFTTAASVTAKATKASAAEVTGFFGTMFGIFQRQADLMGRAAWVDVLSGQTAKAVQMFKTTGPQMSAAFANLGAAATTMGLSMAEQFTVLGQLQSTMSGSEAATKFRAFLAGAGQAQKALGLSFTDSVGRLLSLPEILERIRAKYGQIDTLAKSDLLKKAFGSEEAVGLVKLLIADTGTLRKNIAEVGAAGMSTAQGMAATMADPFERLQRSIENVVITWGGFLLPLITPYIDRLTAAGQAVRAWAERFPHLTRLTGLAAVGVLGLALAASVFRIALGLAGYALLPFRAGLVLLRSALPIAGWLASTAAMLAWRGALLAVQGVLWLAKAALWAFNVALWANPITWVVGLIVGMIAAVALAVIYWDDLRAVAGVAADWLLAKWQTVKEWFGEFWGWLGQGFNAGLDWLTSASPWNALRDGAIQTADGLLSNWRTISDTMGSLWTNMTRGFNAALSTLSWESFLASAGSASAALLAKWQALKSWLGGFLTWLGQGFNRALGWLSNASPWSALRDDAVQAGTAVLSAWQTALAGIQALWPSLITGFNAALSSLSWKNFLASSGQAADWLLAKWQTVKEWFGEFWSWLGQGFNAALDAVLESFRGLIGPESLLGRLGNWLGLGDAGRAETGTLSRRGMEAAVIPGSARAIANVASQTDNSRRLAIGTVNVSTSRKVDGNELLRQLRLAADM
ncbi:MAG: phage tail tape measure protein, partial [Anaerolineae bacterium]|nr:phage tail tape measure protein [Anaerolineae bacterium]